MALHETHKYDDIIDMPHHVSRRHPQMSRRQRAAQFMPFAALTGYERVIEQAACDAEAAVARADAAGGTDNGKPGPRPNYGPGYYAAFVHDPDGNNIEAMLNDYQA